jgi:hypothetical protein
MGTKQFEPGFAFGGLIMGAAFISIELSTDGSRFDRQFHDSAVPLPTSTKTHLAIKRIHPADRQAGVRNHGGKA